MYTRHFSRLHVWTFLTRGTQIWGGLPSEAGVCKGRPPGDRITDTRLWKHFLPATSFAGGKYNISKTHGKHKELNLCSDVVIMTTELVRSLCDMVPITESVKQKALSVYVFLILEAWRIATSKVRFLVNYGFSRNRRTCKRCPKRNDLNYITVIWRPHYIPSCQRSDKILCKPAVIATMFLCDFLLLYIRYYCNSYWSIIIDPYSGCVVG